mmetsp:Transcript_53840/g.172607  ORF Transcript_53840/g.172607 Transcript_53840/m.172607 type:complete len:270 (-) Transcript_53840:421-1230(-)
MKLDADLLEAGQDLRRCHQQRGELCTLHVHLEHHGPLWLPQVGREGASHAGHVSIRKRLAPEDKVGVLPGGRGDRVVEEQDPCTGICELHLEVHVCVHTVAEQRSTERAAGTPDHVAAISRRPHVALLALPQRGLAWLVHPQCRHEPPRPEVPRRGPRRRHGGCRFRGQRRALRRALRRQLSVGGLHLRWRSPRRLPQEADQQSQTLHHPRAALGSDLPEALHSVTQQTQCLPGALSPGQLDRLLHVLQSPAVQHLAFSARSQCYHSAT